MSDDQDMQPITKVNFLRGTRFRKALWLLVFVIIILGGYKTYNYIRYHSKPLHYSYSSTLKDATVTANKPGSKTAIGSMSFQKPAELSQELSPIDRASKIYVQKKGSDVIASIFVSPGPESSDLINHQRQVLNQASGSDYETLKSNLSSNKIEGLSYLINTQFFSGTGGISMKVNVGDVSLLKTASISSDAWQFDFTATLSKTYHNISVVKGKLIYIIGKNNTFNDFLIDAVGYNWDANQATWQAVVDSIKVNQ
ncbi:MAG TPA: hypothetical protein VFB03_03810 [Candidatus Saccharimonadales bacterium]|nr:hypothetical protein [Candidatus Saccharimonadales bacterium]